MDFKIRAAGQADLSLLQAISIKTYRDTFAAASSEADLSDYIERAYNSEKLQAELENADSSFYFVEAEHAVAGYLKLNRNGAQTDLQAAAALEIERIYVLEAMQGYRLGQCLLDKAVEQARLYQKEYIWLGVWEHNEKAQAFYQKNGFYRIGEHAFAVGSDLQTDWLMRKDLGTAAWPIARGKGERQV